MIGSIILVVVLVVELFDWNYWFSPKVQCQEPLQETMRFQYGYEDHNGNCSILFIVWYIVLIFDRKGPKVWREIYEECIDKYQSPINIISDCSCVCPSGRLIWSLTYGSVPLAIRIKNDGHCGTVK